MLYLYLKLHARFSPGLGFFIYRLVVVEEAFHSAETIYIGTGIVVQVQTSYSEKLVPGMKQVTGGDSMMVLKGG